MLLNSVPTFLFSSIRAPQDFIHNTHLGLLTFNHDIYEQVSRSKASNFFKFPQKIKQQPVTTIFL